MESMLETHFASPYRTVWHEIQRETAGLKQDALLDMVLKSMPNIFLVLNPHRQIILANHVLAEATGAEHVSKLYGMRPGEVLDCVHASEMPAGCGTSKSCKSCGAVRAILLALDGTTCRDECRILQRTTGKTLEFQVFATPFTRQSARNVFFVVNDVEAQKRRVLLERVFFHDVLNTAGALFNIAELMMMTPAEEHPGLVQLLKNSAKRLIDELKAHRALLQAEHDELVPDFRNCSPSSLVMETVEFYGEYARPKNIHIRTCFPDEEEAMTTDVLLAGRVLGNLLKNAIEASASGNTVTIGYHLAAGDRIRFFCNNAGVMPESVQGQIFQRSFSTKGTGRGLGAYSVKLLGERFLGGRVWFRSSEKDEGTTFFAEFPLHPTKATKGAEAG